MAVIVVAFYFWMTLKEFVWLLIHLGWILLSSIFRNDVLSLYNNMGRMDQWTDTTSYRHANSHLKTRATPNKPSNRTSSVRQIHFHVRTSIFGVTRFILSTSSPLPSAYPTSLSPLTPPSLFAMSSCDLFDRMRSCFFQERNRILFMDLFWSATTTTTTTTRQQQH